MEEGSNKINNILLKTIGDSDYKTRKISIDILYAEASHNKEIFNAD